MTEQEKQLITQLADRIRNAPPPQIDRDANDLIARAIGSRPDALYILTQTVIIQQMALDQAKAQMEQLQRQQSSQPASQQGSFLPGSQQAAPPPESRYQSGGYSNSPYSGQAYEAPRLRRLRHRGAASPTSFTMPRPLPRA